MKSLYTYEGVSKNTWNCNAYNSEFKGTICFTVTLTCRRWRRKLKEQKKGRGGEFSNNVLIKKKEGKNRSSPWSTTPSSKERKKRRRIQWYCIYQEKKKARTGNHLDPPTPTPLFLSLRHTHHTFPTKRLPSILNS